MTCRPKGPSMCTCIHVVNDFRPRGLSNVHMYTYCVYLDPHRRGGRHSDLVLVDVGSILRPDAEGDVMHEYQYKVGLT